MTQIQQLCGTTLMIQVINVIKYSAEQGPCYPIEMICPHNCYFVRKVRNKKNQHSFCKIKKVFLVEMAI